MIPSTCQHKKNQIYRSSQNLEKPCSIFMRNHSLFHKQCLRDMSQKNPRRRYLFRAIEHHALPEPFFRTVFGACSMVASLPSPSLHSQPHSPSFLSPCCQSPPQSRSALVKIPEFAEVPCGTFLVSPRPLARSALRRGPLFDKAPDNLTISKNPFFALC